MINKPDYDENVYHMTEQASLLGLVDSAVAFFNTPALLVRATIVATALKVCASLFRMSFTSETCV